MSAALPVPRSVRRLRQTLQGLPGRLSGTTFREHRSDAKRHAAQAARSLEQEALDDATLLATEAIVAAPGWVQSLHLLGRILEAQGLREEALECHRGILPARQSVIAVDLIRARSVASAVAGASAGAAAEASTAASTEARPAACAMSLASSDVLPSRKTAFNDASTIVSETLHRTVVVEGSRIPMPAPGQIAPQALSVLDRRYINAATCHVDRIVGGELWQDAHNTLVRDASGRVIEAHTMGNEELLSALMAAHDAVDLGARVILLGARGSGNYYHWMTDILPRLELCKLSGISFGPDDRFLLPTYRATFQIASLARLGIAERQLVFADRVSPFVTAREVVVPFLRNTMATTMGRWLPEYLKRAFLPAGESPSADRRIFVSRHANRSQGRAIGNLPEVEAFFARQGFDIVFPETLEIEAQARLFASSTIVAAPHGAGLTNLVFCAPGTRVIEFYGAHLAPCYHAISALCGLDYYAHHCKDPRSDAVGDEFDRARTLTARRAASFSIDTDAISALLALIDPGHGERPH